MEFYNVYSAVNNEAAYADLRQSDIGIDDFIVYDEGAYQKEAVFIAQEGYHLGNIDQTDFIKTVPNMLLFSENFVKKLSKNLENELDFFPAKLKIQDKELKYFLGKLKISTSLVDLEKSNFYEIDGEKFIDYPPVFLREIKGFEYCAKEKSDDLIWIFTEKFKNLVLENDLKIDFIPI